MSNQDSRAVLLGLTAAAAGASLAANAILLEPEPLLAATTAASDRVRFGMIGVGMQGIRLLSIAINSRE